jgi:hypothetical protein
MPVPPELSPLVYPLFVWISPANLHLVFSITEKHLVTTPPPSALPPHGLRNEMYSRANWLWACI